MANSGSRKYPALDVVKMFSTLTLEHWKSTLMRGMETGNTEKFIAWRYGLQAGLADAASKGLNTDALDLWVMKRCKDLERCMRVLLKRKHKNPLDNPLHDKSKYIAKALEAKRLRDREYYNFLMKSSF